MPPKRKAKPTKKAAPVKARDAKALASAADLTLDPANANQGTLRGGELLRESLETCGLGRSILVDKHGVVIAGNKTLEAARARGVPIEVVQTTGHELVVVQRTDLDLIEDPKARQLAYYDNRVQELDLSWSPKQVNDDLLAGVDLSCAFFPEEIDGITHRLSAAPAATDAPADSLQDVDTLPPAEAAAAPETPAEAAAPAERGVRPTFQIVFNHLTEQLQWTAFARQLRQRYPDLPTPGARLVQYLTEDRDR